MKANWDNALAPFPCSIPPPLAPKLENHLNIRVGWPVTKYYTMIRTLQDPHELEQSAKILYINHVYTIY